MSTSNKTPMYLMPGELTPAQQEQAFEILRNTTKSTRLDRFLFAVRKVGTPIQPCADVETVGWQVIRTVDGFPLEVFRSSEMAEWVGKAIKKPVDAVPLVRRTDMEAQVARVAAEKDAEIAELKRLIQIIAFPVKNDIGTEWYGTPPIYAERDGLHMVRNRRTGYLNIIRWYIQWDGRGQVCSMSEDDSIRLYDRYIGPVFCAAVNDGAAG